jgi:glycosyltransferase involved in cell wall biosynthesis
MFNAEKTIKQCLDSIAGNSYRNYEVILVDDGSTDRTAGFVREHMRAHGNVRLSNAKRQGPSKARNIGAGLARGSILVFLDSDCIVREDWLRRIKDGFDGHDVVSVAGQYCGSHSGKFISKFAFYELLFRERNFRTYVKSASSCNLAVRKEVFDAIGGYPQEFRVGEDIYFSHEVSRKGKILWDRDNGVIHCFRTSVKGYLKQQHGYTKHGMKLMLKRPEVLTGETIQDKGNYMEIAATGIMMLSAAGAFLNTLFLWVAGLAFLSIAALNVPFLSFVWRRENAAFALRCLPAVYLRNLSWALGAVRGLIWP